MRCEMAKVKSESLDKLGTGSSTASSTVRLRSPQASRRMTSEEQKLILEKLTTLEELLKKKDDRPLTFKEACTYLGYAPSYLYKLTYRKVIPHYKPTGKLIFFSKNEVDEWIYKSSVERRVMSADASTVRSCSPQASLGMTKDDGSVPLTTKDPNQMEMGFEEKTERSKKEKNETDALTIHSLRSGQGSAHELLIEFPLRSRRQK